MFIAIRWGRFLDCIPSSNFERYHDPVVVNLEKHVHNSPFQLSGGQQQRVSLARALAIRPDVLLLEEPLSALDAKIRVSLRAQIREIQKQLGNTAIFVTHDQEEALSMYVHIVVM